MKELKRAPARTAERIAPGEYIPMENKETWTVFKCPECAKTASIAKRIHHVYYDGVIEPAVACPHKPCKFSAKIKLVDWVPAARGSA